MPQTSMRAKLHRPHVDQTLIERPQLVRRIHASTRGRMALIVAPAGYGKTTLATQWAAEAKHPVAWFSIDESDNELVRFLSYLVAAIQAIHPDVCPHLLGLLERAPLPDVERLAVTLSNDVGALPQRIALVLDDYHWITDPRHPERARRIPAPPCPQIAHRAHQPQPTSLGTLSAAQQPASRGVAHAQDLRLSEAEAAAQLAHRTPFALSSDEVTNLVARTAVHWLSSEPQKAIEAAQRALLGLPIDYHYVRGMLQLALTLALQATGQVDLAEQMLMAAVAQAELAPSGSHASLRPLLYLISVYFAEGDVVAAAQASRSFLQKALGAKSLLNQQMAYLALGAAAYEMNELEAAADAFERGADLRHAGNVRAGHECLVGRALACHALGRSEAVRATIAQLADYHAEVASSVLTAEAISLQRRLGLLNLGFSINDLIRRSVPARTGMWYGWMEVPAITQVHIALATGSGLAQSTNLAHVDAALQGLMATAVEMH